MCRCEAWRREAACGPGGSGKDPSLRWQKARHEAMEGAGLDQRLDRRDVRCEVTVMVVEADARAHERVHFLKTRRRLERCAEIDALRGGEELDRDNRGAIRRH